MKKLLKFIFISLLMMHAPLWGMEAQSKKTNELMQECYCGSIVAQHRLRYHIDGYHAIVIKGKKEYLCPKEGCQFKPFSKTTHVIHHLMVEHKFFDFTKPGNHEPESKQEAQAKTDESVFSSADLWSAENNNEATNIKKYCQCGKRWPQDKREAQLQHIRTHHCEMTNFVKTFICPNCSFPGKTAEVVLEHNKIHTTNKNQTPPPSKKIKKKESKKSQRLITILPNALQQTSVPFENVTNLPNDNDQKLLEIFLTYNSGELEELFPMIN